MAFIELVVVHIFVLIYISVGAIILPWTIQWLLTRGITAVNYRQETLPCSLGVYLWFMLLLYVGFMLVAMKWLDLFKGLLDSATVPQLLRYAVCLSGIHLLGWIDDTLGDGHVKGLRGHLRQLQEGRVTTGLLKAIGTILIAMWYIAGQEHGGYGELVVQMVVIVLCTNTINLLDLRPGRAIKGYFTISAVVILAGGGQDIVSLQLPVWIAAGLLFVQDVRGKVMLGDAGANYLGFAAGVALIEGTPLGLQIIMALLLINLHIAAERISLSAWIEAKPLLRWLDGLGRDTRMVK